MRASCSSTRCRQTLHTAAFQMLQLPRVATRAVTKPLGQVVAADVSDEVRRWRAA